MTSDFMGVLRSGESKFDIVFVDPPYKSGLGELAVDGILDCGRLEPSGVIVYEHSAELPYTPSRGDIAVRTKVMGSVTAEFIRLKKSGL